MKSRDRRLPWQKPIEQENGNRFKMSSPSKTSPTARQLSASTERI